MPVLQAALDQESYQFLVDNYPDLAEAVEVEVGNGARPEEVGRFVARLTQRPALALRVEQAARFVSRGVGGSATNG
jgi:hypothetical protein